MLKCISFNFLPTVTTSEADSLPSFTTENSEEPPNSNGKIESIPRRTNLAYSPLGLTVALFPNPNDYGKVVMNNFYGFKALVHSPYEFPEVSGKGFLVDNNQEILIGTIYRKDTHICFQITKLM